MTLLFPVRGFLGTGAPFAADFNLVMQLFMGTALIAGVVFAKCKWYRAHGICQTTVLLVNLLMIALDASGGRALVDCSGRRSGDLLRVVCGTLRVAGYEELRAGD